MELKSPFNFNMGRIFVNNEKNKIMKINLSKITFFILFVIAGLLTSQKLQAQLREIPAAVKSAFSQQYPDAQQVNYEDKLIYVLVHFKQSDSASTAKYNSKGIWQWTETAIPLTALPQAVQQGFNKSKYADWQVDHVYTVDLPGNLLRYKLQVEESTIVKRNLYFTQNGRLLSDNLTIY
jgi:hypothetical protein